MGAKAAVRVLVLIAVLISLAGTLDSCGNYGDISLDDLLLKRSIQDRYEPNNSPGQASSIAVGPDETQDHSLYPQGDVDWISFSAQAGTYYVVETFSIEGYGSVGPSDVDTYIYGYAPNGATLLIEDDDSGTEKGFSKFSFKPSVSGIHYVKVVDYNTAHGFSPSRTGDYAIRVSGSTGMPFNPDGLWHVSTRKSHDSDGLSWYYGVDATGTYDTGAQNFGTLTSNPVSVPGGSPMLRFWEWCLDEPGPAYEARWVRVSTDGGVSWIDVYQSLDDLGTWIDTAVDLSPFGGQQVLIRFSFDTLDNVDNSYEGWYIDEVRIE